MKVALTGNLMVGKLHCLMPLQGELNVSATGQA